MDPLPESRRVYHALTHRWGDADDIIVFDGVNAVRDVTFPRMDIAIWRPVGDTGVTTMNTLGMSSRLMPGADYRVELNLGFRGSLRRDDEMKLAAFLANIAEYPFANSLKLDWWERLAHVPSIPCFEGFHQVLFTPGLGDEPFSCFDAPEHVKLLYVIPIAPHENAILAERGPDAFFEYCEENHVDLFAPRPSEPAANSRVRMWSVAFLRSKFRSILRRGPRP